LKSCNPLISSSIVSLDTYGTSQTDFHIDDEKSLNWFRVFWGGSGEYPGSSSSNTCSDYGCRVSLDGHSCYCKAAVEGTPFYSSLDNITREGILSNLFIGTFGPPDANSSSTTQAEGYTAYVANNVVDENTVFLVAKNGRDYYLRNLVSTVTVEGWQDLTPQIYEAEDAVLTNVVCLVWYSRT